MLNFMLTSKPVKSIFKNLQKSEGNVELSPFITDYQS